MSPKRKPGVVKSLAATGASPSIQSQVVAYIVNLLGGVSQNVYRCRMEAFTVDQLPADNVFPDDEQPEYTDATSIDVKFRFKVRHTAAAANEVDATVDARYVRAQQLILADPYLGGLVWFTRYTGRKWEFEKGAVDTVALAVAYEVQFSTSRSDPSRPGI